MRMRIKVLISIAVLMLAIFLTMVFIVNAVFLQSYVNLEKQQTTKSVLQTTNALSKEVEGIRSTVSDWAFWDDTYNFVQTGNESYITANLGNSTFSTLRINLMVFINKSGQIVYAEAFDLSSNAPEALPQDLSENILSQPALWNFTTTDSEMEGIVQFPQESVAFSSQPILTSLNQGPIMGALMMGRYVDSTEISYLSDVTGFPLSSSQYDDPLVPKDFQIARSSLASTAPVFIEPMNSDYVAGYALINDIFSNPTLILKIDLPRDIYKQGLSTAISFSVMVASMCAVFGTAMTLLMETGMLSPLSKLTETVKEIGTNGYNPPPNSHFGTDETSLLAEAIKTAIAQRLAAIEELAGMIGHDLRNPLTGIKNATYYIKTKNESKMDEKTKEMLKIIEYEIDRSNKIVSDLLEYSGKIKLKYVDTTPKTLTKGALAVVIIPKTVQVIDSTDDATEIAVDSDKMKRVFVNLIMNALDAMPQGGTLTITSAKVAKGFKFTFSDTGCGISKENLKKIGSPLFTTKAKGMGFGLPICKRFVEAHGGSLSLESSLDKGTTATIFIPTKALSRAGRRDLEGTTKNIVQPLYENPSLST